MSVLDRYRQQPSETRRREIDYSEWLATEELITDIDVTVSPSTSPALAVAPVSIDPDGKIIEYYAGGGLTGNDYTVTFKITTDDGQVREDEVEITVEED